MGKPPTAGDKMNGNSITSSKLRIEGTLLNYTCEENYYINPTRDLPELSNKTFVNCSSSLTWEKEDPNLQFYCVQCKRENLFSFSSFIFTFLFYSDDGRS